jgi:hypothetical protein
MYKKNTRKHGNKFLSVCYNTDDGHDGGHCAMITGCLQGDCDFHACTSYYC